jgi:Uma2 family endonuclease
LYYTYYIMSCKHSRAFEKKLRDDAQVDTDDGPFVYPDVSVSCDERDRTAQKFSRYPCLIVEVISPGTEAYDRGGKFELYRRLPTLQAYVLVGSEAKTVEVFQRSESQSWSFTPYGASDEIELTSLGIWVSVEDIYEDIVFGS